MGKFLSKLKTLIMRENNSQEIISFTPNSAICYVKYKNNVGIGAIYRSEFPEGTWRTLFITSYQVLQISDVKEIHELRLEFEDKTIGEVNVTPDWIKWMFTSPRDQLNVTVIEFSVTALKVLSRMKYTRLIPAAPIENAKVNVYAPNGCITSGIIIKVSGEIQFKVEGAIGNSGIPLLNENFNVIGIHSEWCDTSNESSKKYRKVVRIDNILDAFKEFVQKQLNGKTENELWIERIDSIPKTELMFIGSGGLGKVYKIYEKNTSSELAIKKVGGFGSLNDYKNQVRALEKEYEIISSLGSHPRIIQFVALLQDEKNVQLMILMEYLEGGSLADKLKEQKPLDSILVRKYFGQILEGVCFLHQRNIFHSNIKPANILFTRDDNLKLCDFGIAVESQTDSTTHKKSPIYYMSPERLRGAPRSSANDIWSIGATFVQMKTGKRLNYEDKYEWQFREHIVNDQLTIEGRPYKMYIESLSASDFRREVISRTLCPESKRANCDQLLSVAFRFLVRRIPPERLHRANEAHQISISGMSYSAARDELFLSDLYNGVVRAIRLRDTGRDLRDVYRPGGFVCSVCHLSESDTLLVSLNGVFMNEDLVALRRDGSEWREAHRLHTEGRVYSICALSDSRVLVGNWIYNYLELLRVESGPHIARLHRFPDIRYIAFAAATCGRDTLVAISDWKDQRLRVCRLHDDYRLEELARIGLVGRCGNLLWLSADRLLATEFNEVTESEAVTELEWSGTQLERRRQFIACSERISVGSWCAVGDGFALVDYNSKALLHYAIS